MRTLLQLLLVSAAPMPSPASQSEERDRGDRDRISQGANGSGRCAGASLEHVVRAITKWLVVARLAAAKIERAVTVGDETFRLEAGTLVGAVTERLIIGPTAGAPKIGFASLERDLIRPFLGHHRFIRHADPLDRLH
jgi:hypothetical protein